MGRLLVDAAALIALGSIGALHLLKATGLPLATTPEVIEETLRNDLPGARPVREMVDSGDLEILPTDAPSVVPKAHGLGAGESALFQIAHAQDVLVLDDLNVRKVAQAIGIRFVGVLGLLVAGVQAKTLQPQDAHKILDDLARSDFRMTAELYATTKSAIQSAADETNG
jgi:predicted nucleic acid-binding protein